MQAYPLLVSSPAAVLPIQNIDTDMIIPKQFLKTIKRTGLSEGLFFEMRYREDGSIVEDFILHQEPFTHAHILIAEDNFGCGSSREHAPWALLDFGIRAIIAPSFADIFFNNCFKNGILPIVLSGDKVVELMRHAKGGAVVSVDLPSQIVRAGDKTYAFEVDAFRKHCLLQGLDDIGLSMQHTDAIAAFEVKQNAEQPWLYR